MLLKCTHFPWCSAGSNYIDLLHVLQHAKVFPTPGPLHLWLFPVLRILLHEAKGMGNTNMWPGPLFLSVLHALVSWTLHSSQTERPVLLLIMQVPLRGMPSFPRPLIHHGPTQMSLCAPQVFILSEREYSLLLTFESTLSINHLCSYTACFIANGVLL